MTTEGTSCLEAFNDGVFAIAITLLILEIRPPVSGANVAVRMHLLRIRYHLCG